jgi:hypothetical protein
MEREGIIVKIYLEKCFESWWDERAEERKLAAPMRSLAPPSTHRRRSGESRNPVPSASEFNHDLGGYWAPASAGVTTPVAGM